MAQGKRRLDRAGCRGRQGVAGDRPAVVVDDDGEPGAAERVARVRDQDGKEYMIDLPNLVRHRGLAPVYQLVPVAGQAAGSEAAARTAGGMGRRISVVTA